LKAPLAGYNENEQDWIKNGQIQKFEIVVELAWKPIRQFLLIDGFEVPDAPKKY
jgi:hypothetical protein